MGRNRTHITELRRAGETICPRCLVARTALQRMKGLLGRRALSSEEGLLLQPAGSVHTWFMRFPIDVVFLDRELRVLRVVEALDPWRMAAARGAKAVLELPAGAAARVRLQVGDELSA
jgi:uncharacterized protein